MVTKKQAHVVPVHKHVKLKAHHAKPYRKRHVGLLFVSLVALVFLGLLLVRYHDQIIGGLSSSRSFVSDLFSQDKSYDVTVASTYGFNVTYNQKTFYASAISSDTGDLYIGSELGQKHAYSTVRFAPNLSSGVRPSTATSSLSLTLHPDPISPDDDVSVVALKDGGIDATKVVSLKTDSATIGGQTFEKTTWQSKSSIASSPVLNAKFVTYTGLVHGKTFTIVVSLGVTAVDESTYTPILDTLSFNDTVGYVAAPTNAVIAKTKSSLSVIDMVMNTGIAAAASNSVNLDSTEKIAALYSPAVVKVYNGYCMDIAIDGKTFANNVCQVATGSGFFVSQDGYLATNGHVATASPMDLALQQAIVAANAGNPDLFTKLISMTKIQDSDIPKGSTAKQALAIIIDAYYKLDTSRFAAMHDVENLFVQVTPNNPDMDAFIQATEDRKEYTSNGDILKAKLVAADFRAIDGIDGFKASDVAIIKVDGKNFPIVKLGDISMAVQGSDLAILGYPGNASENGLVDAGSSEATLTTGKVSSIKNAQGSDKELIETDTTIGHGNSGGPALSDNGDVVGIATYTVDGSGSGNGVFNYIRDIKDFTDLAAARNITFDTNSATQAAWQEGITNFYTSHYSKAVKNFATVKELYPNDSRVDEFTAAAQKRIADGQDVVDFPLIPVLIVAAIVLAGVGFGLFFIIRHHKKHIIYNAGVAQGTVQPASPGAPAQIVAVSPNSPTVGTPIVTVPGDGESNTTPPAEPQTPPSQQVTTPVEQPTAPSDQVVTPTPLTSPTQPVEQPPANPWFDGENQDNDQPKQ